MPFYRVVFANNNIISCEQEKSNISYDKDLFYEEDRGKLIFAYIKAESLAEAVIKANDLIKSVNKRTN